MNKSWRLDEFMEDATKFYQDMEKVLAHKLFHPIVIRRMLSSEQERNYWIERSKLPEFQDYLTEINGEDDDYNLAKNSFGSAIKTNGIANHIKNNTYFFNLFLTFQ
jgi:hypothetical protein